MSTYHNGNRQPPYLAKNFLQDKVVFLQDKIVSSTVEAEAVEVTRRASTWSWFSKTLPTDVASPCVHCFREAGSCVSVQHAFFSCTRMRISCDAHDTPPRVQHFSAFHC